MSNTSSPEYMRQLLESMAEPVQESTDLESSVEGISLTQFGGPRRDDGGDPRQLQLTLGYGKEYVQLTRDEARSLAQDLFRWADSE